MGIKLNRNGWHRKLQNYVLDRGTSKYDDTMNLCPYFWLTIFCVIAVPFVVVFRTCNNFVDKVNAKVAKSFIGTWAEKVNDKINERLDAYLENVTPMQLYKWKYETEKGYLNVDKWISHISKKEIYKAKGFLSAYAYLSYLLVVAEKEAEKLDLERRGRNYRKELRMQKFAKVFSLGILTCFVVGICYFSYWLWVNFTVDWKLVAKIAIFAVSFVVGIGIIAGLNWLAGKLKPAFLPYGEKCKYGLKCVFWYPIKYTGLGIWALGKFVFMYFKNTKDNYCPSITWE